MAAVVQVEGLGTTIAALAAFDPALRRQVNKAGREAAKIVADAAKARAPRRTGRLAGTIRAGANKKGAYVRAGRVGGSESSQVLYAGPIHFGWRARNIRPNPFIYDAGDARIDAVKATYEKQINELIATLGF